jgi:RNA polymerase subunit RPABC4/transcription elongation factor Spt4
MAYTCIHCKVIIEAISSRFKFCPECGQPQLPDDNSDWSQIARFSDLAEAGYFADELRSHGIVNRVVASSHLDSDGTWRSQFQLLVLEAERDTARDWLTNHFAEHDELGWNDDDEPERLPQTTKRLAGVLFIIGCSVSAGLMAGFQLRPPERKFVEFWEVIKSSPTFLSDPRLPGPVRRLEVDEQRGVIRIRQDIDRDGVFDEQIEFRPAG